jgi:hypothetical protein
MVDGFWISGTLRRCVAPVYSTTGSAVLRLFQIVYTAEILRYKSEHVCKVALIVRGSRIGDPAIVDEDGGFRKAVFLVPIVQKPKAPEPSSRRPLFQPGVSSSSASTKHQKIILAHMKEIAKALIPAPVFGKGSVLRKSAWYHFVT